MFLCMVLCAPGQTDESSCAEGYQSDSSASTVVLAGDDFKKRSDTESPSEQSVQQGEARPQREEETLACEQQTGQLVKEVRL